MSQETPSTVPAGRALLARLLGLVALASLGGWLALSGVLPEPAELRAWLEPWGGWAAPLFVLLFAAGTAVGLPAVLFAAAGAYGFGLWIGWILSVIGATLGAGAAFLLARALGRPLLAGRLAGSARWRTVDREVGHHGAVVVLLLRILPVMPFNLLNYLLGLTAIRFPAYLGATAVGVLPGAFVYCYAGLQVAAAAEGRAEVPGVLVAMILLAVFLVAVPVGWRWADRRTGGQLLQRLAARGQRGSDR